MVYVLGVVLLVAASLAVIANQSGKLVDVHELPPFVCDRVEVVPALTSRDAPGKPDSLTAPGRESICARDPGA